MDYLDFFSKKIENLKTEGLYRKYHNDFLSDRKENLLVFSSNDYLGLRYDENIKNVVANAALKYGTGSGGSRLTTGTSELHLELEDLLAKVKKTQAAMVFNSGYDANVGTISALCNKDWTIFSDRNNHASIVDGISLSGGKLSRFRHVDMDDLENRLKSDESPFKLIVSDGVFSMDGDLAPIPELVKLAEKYNSLLMVDDAHGFGVLGQDGSGIAEYFGLSGKINIHMGTLSKSVGLSGGYVAADDVIIDYLRNYARSYIYTTALPPHIIAGAIEAVKTFDTQGDRRAELLNMSSNFKKRLKDVGFNISDTQTPIIPLIVGDSHMTTRFAQELMENGIYVSAIRPPTVANGHSRLRITLNLTHSQEDIQYLFDALVKNGKKVGLL